MRIAVEGVESLRFDDGLPVRAASAVASYDGGLLVVQDDATHSAWLRNGRVEAVRLMPPVAGLDTFEAAAGTKHLKPDLEAAVPVTLAEGAAVLLLGSGSSAARMRCVLARRESGGWRADVADLSPLYAAVAAALGVGDDVLNLEGACVVGSSLRWFHRGLPSAGLPSGSVDVDLSAALGAAGGEVRADEVPVRGAVSYDLGTVAGAGLAVTDAVALPGGLVLVSAAAEQTDNPRDDGDVVGAALVLLAGTGVVGSVPLPAIDGRVRKVEGLAVVGAEPTQVRLVAVVDDDDPLQPSRALRIRLDLD